MCVCVCVCVYIYIYIKLFCHNSEKVLDIEHWSSILKKEKLRAHFMRVSLLTFSCTKSISTYLDCKLYYEFIINSFHPYELNLLALLEYIYIYIYIYIYVCVSVCLSVCVAVCVCAWMCARMGVFVGDCIK